MNISLHQREFPHVAVPEAVRRLAEQGKIKDTSWHNDCFPSFALTPDESVALWVADESPDEREITAKRFVVSLYDEERQWLGNSLETENLEELLAYLEDHFDIQG